MNINIEKFKLIAETAKSRTTDKRWRAAVDKAVAGVESGWWVITELADGVMVTTETGRTYHANGTCGCEAFKYGQACKHRALARLVELYSEETAKPAVSPAPVENSLTAVKEFSTARAALIAGIRTTFAAEFPGYRLDDAVQRLCGPYALEMLGAAKLQYVLSAIA